MDLAAAGRSRARCRWRGTHACARRIEQRLAQPDRLRRDSQKFVVLDRGERFSSAILTGGVRRTAIRRIAFHPIEAGGSDRGQDDTQGVLIRRHKDRTDDLSVLNAAGRKLPHR
jgi:hypothetical protein